MRTSLCSSCAPATAAGGVPHSSAPTPASAELVDVEEVEDVDIEGA